MSAWIVSKKHIDVLVAGLIEAGGYRHRGTWVTVTEENASEVGQMLWRENHKSINYRYNERQRTPAYTFELPKEYAQVSPDKFQVGRLCITVEPGVLGKQVSCYNYQTCEHAAYYRSRAYRCVCSIAENLIRQVPGYNEAAWGV